LERAVVKLENEKELKIFMDPIRQRILRTMGMLGAPVTAKHLADVTGMTPASAKHHLGRLESIGLVEEDHTEQIHGITARFYRVSQADVSICMDSGDNRGDREILVEGQLSSIFSEYKKGMEQYAAGGAEGEMPGEFFSGVVHLTEEQRDAVRESVARFTHENEAMKADTKPYEFALILCGVEHETNI